MARPKKRRRVCSEPTSMIFGPVDDAKKEKKIIQMSVDEYESLRLIDLEEKNQEECAEKMEVGRTTAQAIYNSARKKLTEALVNGYELQISGGDYLICDGSTPCADCKQSKHASSK